MQRQVAEQTLVSRLSDGDTSAMSDLERMYQARIYRLAYRYMKNHEDAEEVTQDVLFRVFQKIGTFRGEAALSSWIYRITLNTAVSRLRSAKFSHPFEVSEADLQAAGNQNIVSDAASRVTEQSSSADDELYRIQLRERLVGALMALPSVSRVPVLLRDVHGLSTDEASVALKIKPPTLKSRLRRGRLLLRTSKNMSGFESTKSRMVLGAAYCRNLPSSIASCGLATPREAIDTRMASWVAGDKSSNKARASSTGISPTMPRRCDGLRRQLRDRIQGGCPDSLRCSGRSQTSLAR